MVNAQDTSPGIPVAAPKEDLCLAFANTKCWRGSAEPAEELKGIDDLFEWCAAYCGAEPALLDRCRSRWDAEAARNRAYTEAIELRETIYALFAAVAAGQGQPAALVAALNRSLASAPARTRLSRTRSGFGWMLDSTGTVSALVAPVLWSAGDLLAGSRLARVRSCANPQCGWLFLDDSKSGTRRWCSMSACGNRAKAHRHYRKQRSAT